MIRKHTLEYYLEMLLGKAGIRITHDVHVEVQSIMGDVEDSLENLQEQITKLQDDVIALQDQAGISRQKDCDDDIDYSELSKGDEDDTGC